MTDTRTEAIARLQGVRYSSWTSLTKIAACAAVAVAVALLPEYPGLEPAGRAALLILLLAAGLWISEAMPAFAVGLLVIGLEIAILGRPGGVFASEPDDWQRFIVVWGSPLIWLFFGGFVLAAAAEKTGLSTWMAGWILDRLGTRPSIQLLGCMGVTFVFSMFISNTATATMMVTVMMPLIRSLPDQDPRAKSLLLGIAFAANLGGMGTIIGSPPNAIAAGALRSVAPIDFAHWIMLGLPPAVVLLAVAWIYLVWRYPAKNLLLARQFSETGGESMNAAPVPLWKRVTVIGVFAVTIAMWLTGSWHGIPATVVSFVPICTLTAMGILDALDIRGIPWDVLLLIAGGLSLGVAVTDTGLAMWLVGHLPTASWGAFLLALVFSYVTSLMSNLMSNTAAANILVPIALVASVGVESQVVVAIALGASAAMCLPISTPPNAIVYGTRRLGTKDLLQGGLLLGLLAPPLVSAWCWIVLR